MSSIRKDFIDAYTARWSCTPEYADGLLRHVEIEYAETENAALRQQLDDVGGQQIQEESAERRRLRQKIDQLTAKLSELKKREE